MEDIECPYCKESFEYDSDPIGQDEETEIECYACDKSFVVSAHWDVTYSSRKADCLNDGCCTFKDLCRTPFIIAKKVGQMCSQCGKEKDRDATVEEIKAELEQLKDYPSLHKITLGRDYNHD